MLLTSLLGAEVAFLDGKSGVVVAVWLAGDTVRVLVAFDGGEMRQFNAIACGLVALSGVT